jgi:hypothetical protein
MLKLSQSGGSATYEVCAGGLNGRHAPAIVRRQQTIIDRGSRCDLHCVTAEAVPHGRAALPGGPPHCAAREMLLQPAVNALHAVGLRAPAFRHLQCRAAASRPVSPGGSHAA